MTKGVQQRRGNTVQHASFNGQQGEITVNTDRWTVVVQDGTTNGGYEHVNLNSTQRLSNKDIVATNLVVSGVSTFQSDVFLGDNIALYFGDGNDLQLLHNATNSTIRNSTGSLFISGDDIQFINAATTETTATFDNNGSVDLYYDNAKKFETSGIGITVTGHIDTDTLTAASSLDTTLLNVSGVSTFTSSSTVLIGTGTSTGTADQQLQVTGNAYIDSVGIGTTVSSAKLHLGAGTTTANTSPLKFDPGVLLTTAEAGAVEFDGRLFYSSPTASRALNASIYYYVNRDAFTLASSTAAQNWLTAGVELEASTQYEFEGLFALDTSGTVSHIERTQFGGTATVTRIGYYVQRSTRTTTATGVGAGWFTATSAQSMTGAITTAQGALYQIKGIVEISAAGTFIPQFSFSAAPGGTSTILAGAWFKIHAIGLTGSDVSIGTWA